MSRTRTLPRIVLAPLIALLLVACTQGPSTQTVSGRVTTLYGLPLAGAFVSSQGVTTTTDATGAFTLPGLSVPYDLSVWNTAESWAHVYEGLSANQLTLSPNSVLSSTGFERSADIGGNLSGDGVPIGANQELKVWVEGVNGLALGRASAITGESEYAVSARWTGSETRQVVVHALLVETDADGYPTAYLGYAKVPLTLTDANPAALNLDLGSALATQTVHLDIDSDISVTSAYALVQLGPEAAIPVGFVVSAATSHDFLMPVIPDATYGFVAVSGLNGFAWQSGVTGESASVVMPQAIALVSPADGTTGVTTSTPFSVSPTSGRPVTYFWRLDDGLEVAVTTMVTSHTIPDLEPYGLALPAATDGFWQVVAHDGSTVEDGTDYMNLLSEAQALIFGGTTRGFKGEGSLMGVLDRDFTTAP